MNHHLRDHDAMVANILSARRRASVGQVEAGMVWYSLARQLVQLIADRTGIDSDRVCFALAALSPRNPWKWNVADAYSFAAAAADGQPMPSATTYKRNWATAWQALANDGSPWLTSAMKVTSFVSCILYGSLSFAVVIDTWAIRVATDGLRDRVNSDAEYNAVADAYRAAAAYTGELPSTIQAITWLVGQSEGLGSKRRGRHDLACKAGTPDFLKEALS